MGGCCSLEGDVHLSPNVKTGTVFDIMEHKAEPLPTKNDEIKGTVCFFNSCPECCWGTNAQAIHEGRDALYGYATDYMVGMWGERIKKYATQMKSSEIEVESAPGIKIKCLVTTPNGGAAPRSCLIYCHGGGACTLDAKLFDPICQQWAINNDCVVVNVDYRLAPEAKHKDIAYDLIAAINYVKANAATLGVDDTKIALAGDSAGSWVTTSACYHMAINDMPNPAKAVFLRSPMLSHQIARVPIQKCNGIEKISVQEMTGCYQLLATDYEAQWKSSDPQLFPGLMPEDVAAKLPPCVIMTSEYDFMVKDAHAFAGTLQKVGKLLDFYSHPGTVHCYEHTVGDTTPGESDASDYSAKQVQKAWKKYVTEI